MIESRPDRVTIRASQLAANNFPPVCAMTGRPAEEWRLFRFGNPPDWAVMGVIGIGGAGMITRRVSGYLPLTKSARERLAIVETLFALLPLGLLLEIVAFVMRTYLQSDPALLEVAHTVMIIGLVLLPGFVVGVILRSFLGPGAKVVGSPGQPDKLVELRRVHPLFVAAVKQQQAGWLAQLPGSN